MANTKAPRPTYRCVECGWTTAKWVGRCGECQAWSTVQEAGSGAGLGALGSGRSAAQARAAAVTPTTPARPVSEVPVETSRARGTGVGELDRVLGGGLVPGAVVLVAGEPGVGKSTLLLDVAAKVARALRGAGSGAGTGSGTNRVLYVSGEESTGQVRLRAERVGAVDPDLLLAAEQDLPTVLGHVETTDPALLVVDSVQTLLDPGIEGGAGGTAQVRAVTGGLIGAAKERAMPTLLVGHVTKDGSIAGPRTLEHLVDVVLQIEGDRHNALRLVRAVKNRYGATDEVGCFELVEDGIRELPDPSGLFLSGGHETVPGTCVTIGLEGRRPLPVEVQSLVAPATQGGARRTTAGVDGARVAMTIAVLHARARIPLAQHDVYVSTVGGARAGEPAADLALALALASAARGTANRAKLVAVGEVGLAGEVRRVTGVRRRLQEAARLGFTEAIVPERTTEDLRGLGIRVHRVSDLVQACRVAMLATVQ